MRIEIDQSGKVENTNKHTFLAYSNSHHSVLKISSVEKRKIQKYFRSQGKPKIFIYLTFAALIVILLENIRENNAQIIIDTEYLGKGSLIKNLIKSLDSSFPAEDVSFHQIGRRSRAHFLAYGTAIKKLNPDIIVKANDIFQLIKKSGSA